MIPRIIHQVWIGPLPAPTALMETWRAAHPDWRYSLWTSERGWKNQAQIDRMPEWNGKADIMRYEILEREGGVYVDADSECIRALDDSFLRHDSFACYEHELLRPNLIATGYVGACAGNRLMRACIEGIKPQLLDADAWMCVGPLFFTRMAASYHDLHIYSARTFIPWHYSGAPAPGDGPVYAKQYWGSTFGYERLQDTKTPSRVGRRLPEDDPTPSVPTIDQVVRDGDLGRALDIVQNARRSSPRDCGLLWTEAQLTAACGQYDASAAALGLLRKDGDELASFGLLDARIPILAELLLCRIRIHQGRAEEAERIARDMIDKQRSFGPAWLALGEALLMQGKSGPLEGVRRLLSHGGEAAIGLAVLDSLARLRRGEPRAALETLAVPLVNYPREPLLLAARLRALLAMGAPEPEVSTLLSALLLASPLDVDVRALARACPSPR
jgi:hypothetical protein